MIVDKLGVPPGLQWVFTFGYGTGLALTLGLLYAASIIIDNRWFRITRQYRGVKFGDPALAVATWLALWIVNEVTPADQSFWYHSMWFQWGLFVDCVILAVYLKAKEYNETRRKSYLHRQLFGGELSTDWLNYPHERDYFRSFVSEGPDEVKLLKVISKLKYGVAYSKKQHFSGTGLGHVLAFALMAYAFVLSALAAGTQVFRLRLTEPGVPGLIGYAMVLVVVGFAVWVIMGVLDNTRERPDLQYVHPDTGWFPKVRKLFGRSSQHEEALAEFTHDPDGSDRTEGGGNGYDQPSLVDELVDPPQDDLPGGGRLRHWSEYPDDHELQERPQPQGYGDYGSAGRVQGPTRPQTSFGLQTQFEDPSEAHRSDGSLADPGDEPNPVPPPAPVETPVPAPQATVVPASQDPKLVRRFDRVRDATNSQVVDARLIDAVDPRKSGIRPGYVGAEVDFGGGPAAPEQPSERPGYQPAHVDFGGNTTTPVQESPRQGYTPAQVDFD